MLGEPQRLVKERLQAGQPTWRNPTEKFGKRVWYSASIGSEPHIADVVLQRVQEAALAGYGANAVGQGGTMQADKGSRAA
jgi:hypothetical protein